jgi:acetoin utilization deacetylase AcuC-like enzyme
MTTVFHHPGYAAPIGGHVMPMRKFVLVAEALGSFSGIRVCRNDPIPEENLLRVHTPEYVAAVRSGQPRALAESQKFPWSEALYPSVLLTSGGVLAAARQALQDGVSGALASGFHHACADHGEGFCTFNGLVVSLEALRAAGAIRNAAVLDLDLHYGNGTGSLAATRPWLFALSLYGNDYWNNVAYRDVTVRRHQDGANHVSAPIPNGAGGSEMLDLLDRHLPSILSQGGPDILFFQAGADPLRDDPYSPLDLTHDDLFERDRRVFVFAKENRIPIAWVLAGGYTPDTSKVVEVHVNTARAAIEVFGGG